MDLCWQSNVLLFNMLSRENWASTCKRMKLEHFLTPYTKINSKWIKDVNVAPETIKLLDENIVRALSDIHHSKILYDPPPRVMKIKAKMNKWDLSSVQSLSRVWLFATPWSAACQASRSITNSRSSPKFMSESAMPSSHLILCRPLLLLPPNPPSLRVFSNESTLRMRWPKYWSFSFSIIPCKEIPGLISFRMTGWISLQSKGLSRVFSNTTVQKHQFFGAQLSSQSNSHIHTWLQEKP